MNECVLDIENQINKNIDQEMLPGQVYYKPAVIATSKKLNKRWGAKVTFVRNYKEDAAYLAKNSEEIKKIAIREFAVQQTVAKSLKTVVASTPRKPDEPKQLGLFDQRDPSELKMFLQKYGADTEGIITQGNRKFLYTRLQQDLNDTFGEGVYNVLIKEDDTYYVAYAGTTENVVKVHIEYLTSKKKSIFERHNVSSKIIHAADKLSSIFGTTVRVISEEKAKKISPFIRKGTASFYDPRTNTAYLIMENMKETSALHEVFSHPFIIYIEKNHNLLYQRLLESAMANPLVRGYVDAYYKDYNGKGKEYEYIAHAIDQEFLGELKDTDLITKLKLFWKRIISYIREKLNMETDLSKFSSMRDVVEYALTTSEKLTAEKDVSNMDILELFDEGLTAEEEKQRDEALKLFSAILDANKNVIARKARDIEEYKDYIRGLNPEQLGKYEKLETFTALINKLSRDLSNSVSTREIIFKDPYLTQVIQSIRSISSASMVPSTDLVMKALDSVMILSQIIDESLIVSDFIKTKVVDIKNDKEMPFAEKAKLILQYKGMAEAIGEALENIKTFFLDEEALQSADNHVVEVVKLVYSNLQHVYDINTGMMKKFFVGEFQKYIPDGKEEIERVVKAHEEELAKWMEYFKTRTTDAGRLKGKKEIENIKNKIQKLRAQTISEQNILDVFEGKQVDESMYKVWIDAAMNSKNPVTVGYFNMLRTKIYNSQDKAQTITNRFQGILERYMASTGQQKGDMFNLAKFFKPLYRKTTYKERTVKSVLDPVTADYIFEDEMEEVTRDVLIGEFKYELLLEELDSLKLQVEKEAKNAAGGASTNYIKALNAYKDFKKKYFDLYTTEEFDRRTEFRNTITNDDLKGVEDENGNAITLDTHPHLINIIKEKLTPIYDEMARIQRDNDTKEPSDVDLHKMRELKKELASLSSFNQFGTLRMKNGVDLAIAKALQRTRRDMKGVYSYYVTASAEAKYKARFLQMKAKVNDDYYSGIIGETEVQDRIANWHKIHSTLSFTKDFKQKKLEASRILDEASANLESQVDFLKLFQLTSGNVKKSVMSALWENIYDELNSLKDLDNIVEGSLAGIELQKYIRDSIRSVEITQNNYFAYMQLNNAKDKVEMGELIKHYGDIDYNNPELTLYPNVKIEKHSKRGNEIKKSNAFPFFVPNKVKLGDGNKVVTSKDLFTEISNFDMPDRAVTAKLQRFAGLLLAVYKTPMASIAKTSLSQEQVSDKLVRLAFRESKYANRLAVYIKYDLRKLGLKSELDMQERVYNVLDKELDHFLNNPGYGESYYASNKEEILMEEYNVNTVEELFKLIGDFSDVNGENENVRDKNIQVALDAIDEYNEESKKAFEIIRSLTERVTTPYYDSIFEGLLNEQKSFIIQELSEKIKKDKNYDSATPEEQALIQEEIFKLDTLKSVKDKALRQLKKTDWFLNNHYKKVEYKNGIAVEVMAPTPLWTMSIAVDEDARELTPNMTYAKRRINEFLKNEAGDDVIKDGAKVRLKTPFAALPESDEEKEQLPVSQIINNELFKNYGIVRPKKVLYDGTPSPYLDSEYASMVKSNPALREVVDELTKLFYLAQERLNIGAAKIASVLPAKEAKGWEVLQSPEGNVFKRVWENTKNKFMTRPQDADEGYGRADFGNRLLEAPPVRFVSDIPYEQRDKDVMGNILDFIVQSHMLSTFNELMPTSRELIAMVEKNNPAVQRQGIKLLAEIGTIFGKKIKTPIKGKENHLATHLNDIFESVVLNKKRAELTTTIPLVGEMNVTKALDNLTSASAFSTLAGVFRNNILMNYIMGKYQIWLETLTNGLIDRNNYNKGLVQLYQYMITDFNSDFYKVGKKSLTGQVILRYNTQSKEIYDLFGAEFKRTPTKDYLSSDVLFKTRRITEFELSNGVVLAFTEKIKVISPQGETLPLFKVYELDSTGNLVIKKGFTLQDGTPFTEAEETKIRIRVENINLALQGNYSQLHKVKLDRTVMGGSLFFFRKHLPSYWNKAWGEEQMYHGLGAVREGHNRKAWVNLWNVLKNITDKDAREIAMEKFKNDNKDSTDIHRAYLHNSITFVLFLMLDILGGDDDDDKKKRSYDSFILKTALYQLTRLKSDLELTSAVPIFAGLEEIMGIYKNPSIMISKTGMDIIKTVSHLKDYVGYKLGIVDKEDVVLKKDYYAFDKGDLKIMKDLGKLTGLTGATLAPGEMLDNFKNVNKNLYR